MHGLENASIRSLLAKLKFRYVACGLTKITEYICCYNENSQLDCTRNQNMVLKAISLLLLLLFTKCQRPSAADGHTTFIATDRGHLLPGMKAKVDYISITEYIQMFKVHGL